MFYVYLETKGVDPGGRWDGQELGGVGGGEIITRIYYVWKSSIFNTKEKNELEWKTKLYI